MASHVDSQSPPQCTGKLRKYLDRCSVALDKNPPLATDSCRAGKNGRFANAKSLLEQIKHHFVVDYRICVVHLHWVGPIVEDD